MRTTRYKQAAGEIGVTRVINLHVKSRNCSSAQFSTEKTFLISKIIYKNNIQKLDTTFLKYIRNFLTKRQGKSKKAFVKSVKIYCVEI